MRKHEQPPPLTLLVGAPVAEVSRAFRSFIEADKDYTAVNADLNRSVKTEIFYHGVSFIVSIQKPIADRARFKNIFCNVKPSSMGCGVSIGLDAHVAGGEQVPAIIQALLAVARSIGTSLGAQAVIWHPAGVISGFAYFSEAVSDYCAGGAIPVLALVNFKSESDGKINSTGLSYLSGQELQVARSAMDDSDMMRRVVRVVHDMAVNGQISKTLKLVGIEPEEVVELQPLPEYGHVQMKVYSTSIA